MLFTLLATALVAQAQISQTEQTVTIDTGTPFCKVESFSQRMNKPAPTAFKACDSLKDKEEVQVASAGECKERALNKAAECLKKAKGQKEAAVKWKFIEKFKNTSKSTTLNCEIDSEGGNACP